VNLFSLKGKKYIVSSKFYVKSKFVSYISFTKKRKKEKFLKMTDYEFDNDSHRLK